MEILSSFTSFHKQEPHLFKKAHSVPLRLPKILNIKYYSMFNTI